MFMNLVMPALFALALASVIFLVYRWAKRTAYAEVTRPRVQYFSRKHGRRMGTVLAVKGDGRAVIHLDDHPPGVTVRRQLSHISAV